MPDPPATANWLAVTEAMVTGSLNVTVKVGVGRLVPDLTRRRSALASLANVTVGATVSRM